MERPIYDLLGIGFGPANIALAIALEERGNLGAAQFLEQAPAPRWQSAMLLDGSDIQNNPLRDLVTPRNPRSRYTFVNFLHDRKRLFEYLNLGLHYPLRKEYEQYIQWVARHFDSFVRYGERVTGVSIEDSRHDVPLYRVRTAGGGQLLTRAVVFACGRTPAIPKVFKSIMGSRVFHLTDYIPRITALAKEGPLSSLCVLGGSQSAVEIVLDLTKRFPEVDVVNVMRGYGYSLKDTSPFSDHVYFPEHVDYYYNASPASKRSLDAQLRRTNYSSADGDVIHQLYLSIYEQKLEGRLRVDLRTNSAVRAATLQQGVVRLAIEEIHRRECSTVCADGVILATGFRDLGPGEEHERIPSLLVDLEERVAFNEEGFLHVNRDYSLNRAAGAPPLPPIYLNGLCEASHGMGDAGSFSLLALRSDTIAASLERALSELGAAVAEASIG